MNRDETLDLYKRIGLLKSQLDQLIEMENDRQRELIQMMNDQLISLRLRNIELRVQLEEVSHLRKEIQSLKKKHPAPTLRGEGCVAQGPA